MATTDASNQFDVTTMGTPLDYSESVYRFYLEVADCRAATRRLIEEFLPQHHAERIVDLDYGLYGSVDSSWRLGWIVALDYGR